MLVDEQKELMRKLLFHQHGRDDVKTTRSTPLAMGKTAFSI